MPFLHEPPYSTSDFLNHARDCLSESMVRDLERLAHLRKLNRLTFSRDERLFFATLFADTDFGDEIGEKSSPHHLRYLFWAWLATFAESPFVRRLACSLLHYWHHVAQRLNDNAEPVSQKINDILSSSELDSFIQDEMLAHLNHALIEGDPLKIERTIAHAVLAIVEDSLSTDQFSSHQVFAYFFKLMLSERFASFDQTKGQAVLDEILERVSRGVHHE